MAETQDAQDQTVRRTMMVSDASFWIFLVNEGRKSVKVASELEGRLHVVTNWLLL